MDPRAAPVGPDAIRACYRANEPAFLGGDESPSDTLKRVIGGQP
jgi:hypothetical protein